MSDVAGQDEATKEDPASTTTNQSLPLIKVETVELNADNGTATLQVRSEPPVPEQTSGSGKGDGNPFVEVDEAAVDDSLLGAQKPGLSGSSPLPDDVNPEEGPSLSTWCASCYRSPLFQVYISHALSSWGDRMWAFTMGMLLVDWENLQSLRTVAIHQFCQSTAVFIFGALIGSWVDRARRLRATVSSIIIQNVFVCVSAAVLLFLLKTTEDRDKSAPAEWQHHVAIAVAIGFSTLAYMASVACNLTVVKDWVPAMCNENRAKLTSTNAVLKRIDLTTGILSPLLAGGVMHAAGPWAGGLVVVCWNIVSAPCEIMLLYSVYKRNRQLQAPKQVRPSSSASMTSKNTEDSQNCLTSSRLVRPAITLVKGWSTYWRQIVRWSGASLSSLYFTVLSFDAVTTAYVRSLCVTELVVAAVRIGSFVLGLIGTIVFPHFRKKYGLRKSGSIFFIGHAIILGVAVISVFLPGSPFAPVAILSPESDYANSSPIFYNDSNEMTTSPNDVPPIFTITPTWSIINETAVVNVSKIATSHASSPCKADDNIGGFRWPHLWVLCFACIISRLTLWGTDLSINQSLVERVDPKERGVVNGVQNSLNQLVDLFRLITVICVPYPSQYGYLVIATFAWIVGGAVLYCICAPADEARQAEPDYSRRKDRMTRPAAA